MSENNLQVTPESEGSTVQAEADQSEVEEFIVKINKDTNEIVIKNPRTGAEFVRRSEEKKGPLTADEFRKAWDKLRVLGVTWTTDIPPIPSLLKGYNRGEAFWKEYGELQKEFPTLPREVGSAVINALLGPKPGQEPDEKALIVKDLLTQTYRSEFFFKYAVKVPYFEDIDWEVVIKAQERNVTHMPKIAYALLMLSFTDPVDVSMDLENAANEIREPEFMTVAVNEDAIDRLLEKLTTIKTALIKTQRLAESLTEMEESSNGGTPTEK